MNSDKYIFTQLLSILTITTQAKYCPHFSDKECETLTHALSLPGTF